MNANFANRVAERARRSEEMRTQLNNAILNRNMQQSPEPIYNTNYFRYLADLTGIVLPNYTIDHESGAGRSSVFKITIPDFRNLCGSSITGSSLHSLVQDPLAPMNNDEFLLSYDSIQHFPHDLAFSMFSDNTDVKMGGHYPRGSPYPPDCNNSPDMLIAGGAGSLHWVEFGTTRAVNPSGVVCKKIDKYATILSRFLEYQTLHGDYTCSSIDVIAANMNGVCSTVQLEPETVTEIVSLFRFANSIRTYVSDMLGLEIQDADEKSEERVTEEVKSIFRSVEMPVIPPKSERPFGFHREMYDRLERMGKGTDENDNFNEALKLYVGELNKEKTKTRDYILNSREIELKNYSAAKERLAEYWDPLAKEPAERAKRSTKPVHLIPLIFPQQSEMTGEHELPVLACDPNYAGALSHIMELWCGAVSEASNKDLIYDTYLESLHEEAVKKSELVLTDERAGSLKKFRGAHFKVTVDYNHATAVKLAERGIRGKKFSKLEEAAMDARHREMSLSIHSESATHDIDEWLLHDGPDLMSSEGIYGHINYDRTKHLADVSLSSHDSSVEVDLPITESLSSTAGFLHFSVVSDIYQELAYSACAKLNPNEWGFKKVPKWDVWILYKAVNTDGIVFFSLMMPKRTRNVYVPHPVFTQMEDFGNFWATDFLSTNTSKNVNGIKSAAFFGSMYIQYARFYKQPNQCKQDGSITMGLCREAWSDLLLMMAMNADDKARTEEAFTLARYICMDKFTSSLVPINRTKMVDKLPTVFRSRLQLWAVRKLSDLMLSPRYRREPSEANKTLAGEDDYTADEDPFESGTTNDMLGSGPTQSVVWLGITHPFLGHLLPDAQHLIELFYLGYAKNKDEKTFDNVTLALIKKMIKEDLELLASRSSMVPDMGAMALNQERHEYSMELMIHSIYCTRKRFSDTMGKAWQQILTTDIAIQMDRLLYEDMATLKASSTFKSAEIETPSRDGKFRIHRVKVMEAMASIMEEYQKETPFKASPLILEKLISRGHYLDTDTFRKNQHGGLREIFVLPGEERVIQAVIERISRSICSFMGIETLTNPALKSSVPVEHAVKSHSTYHDPLLFSINSSNDAKTWSQGTDAPKLCLFLLGITPKIMHGFIIKALRLWEDKRIRMPDGVLTAFHKANMEGRELIYEDDTYTRLFRGWKGESEEPFIRGGDTFIRTSSGFMQGILHYTSSAHHAGALIARDMLFHHVADPLFTVVTNDLVSSDDSCRLATLCLRKGADDQDKLMGIGLLIADQQLATKWFRGLGIQMSPKSTFCTPSVVEFNSEFTFGPSAYKPTLKWVIASMSIAEGESFYERQEVFSSLATQLLESGAPIQQVAENQFWQAYLHYQMMGLFSSDLGEDMMFAFEELPDAMLGFFYFDNPISAGLCGLTYNAWNHVQHFEILSKSYAQLITEVPGVMSAQASLMRPVKFRMGEMSKWRDLVRRMSARCPNWREKIEENPELLYVIPVTLEDSIIRMLVKLTSPGVGAALGAGNALSKVSASGSYLIHRACISVDPVWSEVMGSLDNKPTERFSLLKLTTDLKKLLETKDPLDDFQMKALFPYHDSFNDLKERLSKLVRSGDEGGRRPSGPCRVFRHIRCTFIIYGDLDPKAVTLEQIVKKKWFNSHVCMSERMFNLTWASAMSGYQFLRDNPEDSLKASVWKSHIPMRNFIARSEMTKRQVSMIGCPSNARLTHDPVFSIVVTDQWPGVMLMMPSSVGGASDLFTDQSHLRILLQRITLLLVSPLKENIKKQILKSVVLATGIPEPWNGEVLSNVPHRLMRVSIIMKIIREQEAARNGDTTGYTMDRLKNDIYAMRKGTIGGYLHDKATKKNADGKWKGKSSYNGIIGACSICIEFEDHTIVRITVDKVTKLSGEMSFFNNLMRKMNVTSCSSKYVNESSSSYLILDPDTKQFRVSFKKACPIIEDSNLHGVRGDQLSSVSIEDVQVVVQGQTVSVEAPISYIIANGSKKKDKQKDSLTISLFTLPPRESDISDVMMYTQTADSRARLEVEREPVTHFTVGNNRWPIPESVQSWIDFSPTKTQGSTLVSAFDDEDERNSNYKQASSWYEIERLRAVLRAQLTALLQPFRQMSMTQIIASNKMKADERLAQQITGEDVDRAFSMAFGGSSTDYEDILKLAQIQEQVEDEVLEMGDRNQLADIASETIMTIQQRINDHLASSPVEGMALLNLSTMGSFHPWLSFYFRNLTDVIGEDGVRALARGEKNRQNETVCEAFSGILGVKYQVRQAMLWDYMPKEEMGLAPPELEDDSESENTKDEEHSEEGSSEEEDQAHPNVVDAHPGIPVRGSIGDVQRMPRIPQGESRSAAASSSQRTLTNGEDSGSEAGTLVSGVNSTRAVSTAESIRTVYENPSFNWAEEMEDAKKGNSESSDSSRTDSSPVKRPPSSRPAFNPPRAPAQARREPSHREPSRPLARTRYWDPIKKSWYQYVGEVEEHKMFLKVYLSDGEEPLSEREEEMGEETLPTDLELLNGDGGGTTKSSNTSEADGSVIRRDTMTPVSHAGFTEGDDLSTAAEDGQEAGSEDSGESWKVAGANRRKIKTKRRSPPASTKSSVRDDSARKTEKKSNGNGTRVESDSKGGGKRASGGSTGELTADTDKNWRKKD